MTGGAIEAAVAAHDARLLAAAARAGVALPPAAEPVLLSVDTVGLAVAVARRDHNASLLVHPRAELTIETSADPPPPVATSVSLRRTLLAVLVACRDPDRHDRLWPGRTATVADVARAAGVHDESRVRHTKGALRQLTRLHLVDLADDGVGDHAPVRFGPSIATLPATAASDWGDLLDAAAARAAGGPTQGGAS